MSESDLLRRMRASTRARARDSLMAFAALLNPSYTPNWHHWVIADVLEKMERGEIKRAIISMPPRHGKSELCTRLYPAWFLGRNPSKSVIVSAYNTTLASRFMREIKRIMSAREYARIFPGVRLPSQADRAWTNQSDLVDVIPAGGELITAGVGGAVTGLGADQIILDDPIKNREEAYSPTYRERAWGFWESTLLTRMQDALARLMLILTRWHQDDVAGRILRHAEQDGRLSDWVVINLPALKIGEPSDIDPRRDGEALWPERFPREWLDERPRGPIWEALYQGQPSSAAGELVSREWIRYYADAPPEGDFDKIVQAWDLNFGKKSTDVGASYVSGQCWGRLGGRFYLLDEAHGRWSHNENKRQVAAMRARWPECRQTLIEDAASGRPLIDDLSGSLPGIVAVPARGSKVARFESVLPLFEAGQIMLPRDASWVRDYIEEIVTFPAGRHDDRCDAAAMALSRLATQTDWSSWAGMDLTAGQRSASPAVIR